MKWFLRRAIAEPALVWRSSAPCCYQKQEAASPLKVSVYLSAVWLSAHESPLAVGFGFVFAVGSCWFLLAATPFPPAVVPLRQIPAL